MVKLNNECMTDRSLNAGAYKYMRSEAKRMLKEVKDPSIKRFCEAMLKEGECWSFLYTFLCKG